MAGATEWTDKTLEDLTAARELLLTSVKPPEERVTTSTLLLLPGKSVTSSRCFKVILQESGWQYCGAPETHISFTYIYIYTNSTSEQPAGILPLHQEESCFSTICKEILLCSHHKASPWQLSHALTSKRSTGDPVNETLLTNIVQVESDPLTCVPQSLSTTLVLGPSSLTQLDTSVIC